MVFNSQANAILGAGNTLTNDGILSPGGSGIIQTTAVTGNLVQSASGTLTVDVDLTAGLADRLNITDTAELNGNVAVQVINPVAGPQQNTILSAAGGVTDNGLGLIASPLAEPSRRAKTVLPPPAGFCFFNKITGVRLCCATDSFFACVG